MATWNMISLQDPTSPFSDNLIYFYNLTMMMMFMIIIATLFIMTNIIMNNYKNQFLLKNHTIEVIWTILPMLILIFIAFPSLKTLYFIDELWNPPFFTIKAIGHQWYWSYEYPDFNNVEFDSYMKTEMNLNLFRLLDVDNRMIVPFNIPIRLLCTSVDVIHSWTIPSLGMKLDATPGRINQLMIFSFRPGLFFGQCSEICGANHSFMPIAIEITSMINFKKWLNSF